MTTAQRLWLGIKWLEFAVASGAATTHESDLLVALAGASGHPSLWAAIESIAPKIGCVPQTLHEWVPVIAEFLKQVDDFEERYALPTEDEAAEMLTLLQSKAPIKKLMENPISNLTERKMSGPGTKDPFTPVVGT